MIRYNKDIQGTRESDHYATPKQFYRKLNCEFDFDLDPCPLRSKVDGLSFAWRGSVYVNPPYSNIKPFIEKGIKELKVGNAQIVVYLLPVRSDTKYWYNLIMKIASEIRFVKGRLKFNESKSAAPFPCVIIIFDKSLSGNCITSTYSKN